MPIKRFTISSENAEHLQPEDKFVEIYQGPDGLTFVVDRDVPDAPAYYVSVVGTATIENKFGVMVPGIHGVWVETNKKLYFRAFVAKNSEQAVFPERRVVDFKPDPSAEESILAAQAETAKAKEALKKERRRRIKAEEALTFVAADLHTLRLDVESPMVTAQGATMQEWLRKN